MGTQSVLHTKGQGVEISFFSPPLDSSALGGERQHSGRGGELGGGGCTRNTDVDLEERSGLGGDVDSEERRTLGGHGSDAQLTRVHLEGTGSAHGGYDCEKRTRRIWTRRKQDLEPRLIEPGQTYERGGRDLGESAPTVNEMITTNCKRDHQHQL